MRCIHNASTRWVMEKVLGINLDKPNVQTNAFQAKVDSGNKIRALSDTGASPEMPYNTV